MQVSYRKKTQVLQKNFLGNLDSESLELLWVLSLCPPRPKKKTSLFAGTGCNWGKPSDSILGLGSLCVLPRVRLSSLASSSRGWGSGLVVLGELGVDSNGCWWWEDLRHHNGWWAWKKCVGWSIFWILEWFLPGWSKLFFVHSDGEGRTRTWYTQVLEGVHSQQDIPGHWKKQICDLLAFIETCKGNQGVFFTLVMNPKPSSNFLIRMGCLNNHPSRNYPLVN